MSLFKPAKNQQAFLKAGIMGFAGSGKTYTSMELAKGIWESSPDKKPIYFMDTETGSDFFVKSFEKAKIPFFVSKSRSFTHLLQATEEAEKNASIFIVDSISHFWKEIMDAYQKKKNRNRLLFQDWGPIKNQWQRWTDAYVNSKIHIIMCGRAGYEYDYFTDEGGSKQLAKTGTKMKAESEMGYEPSLLIEMVKEKKDNPDGRVEAKMWDHVAYVLKDRTQLIEGKVFRDPGFKEFKPVFDFLNIGGEHVGVKTDSDTGKLFAKDGTENFLEIQRRKNIILEEIQNELVSAWPGQTSKEKKAKTDMVHWAFGSRSWEGLKDLTVEQLTKGSELITTRLAEIVPEPA